MSQEHSPSDPPNNVGGSRLSDEAQRPFWLTLHSRSLSAAAEDADATYVDTATVAGGPNAYVDGALTPAASEKLANLVATAGP